MRAKSVLERTVRETVAGPSATFSKLHAYKAIVLLGERSLGRNTLFKELGIGPGAVRTLITRLKNMALIEIESSGCKLTEKGRAIRNEIMQHIPSSKRIVAGRLSVGRFDHAVIVRGASERVRSAIEQRDAAILQGARGATTILFKNEKFALPGDSSDCERDFPDKAWSTFRDEFSPRNGDVIVVSSAESSLKAEYGALAAAWTLLDALFSSSRFVVRYSICRNSYNAAMIA